MVLFDNAPLVISESLEAAGVDLSGFEATLVRDLLGRIRVYLQHPKDWLQEANERRQAVQRLNDSLKAGAPYAAGSVILDELGVQPDEARMPLVDDLRAARHRLKPGPVSAKAEWFIYERRFSKDLWRIESAKPMEPWGFSKAVPRVVSFYGFKGGVGRTTALAAFALYLSDKGKSVVVLDLDLEAPGAAAMLATEDIDLGIVDFLIESRVERQPPLALSRYYQQSPLAKGSGTIRVFPAGKLDRNYIEKLGRIDIQGLSRPAHAVRMLFLELIKRVRSDIDPDAILLDVRAGLHDLGGASLSGLSHLELLFAENSPQTWAGFPLVLRHLGRLRADWVKFVHTMAPPRRRPEETDCSADFRKRAYEMCSEEYYLADEVPGPQDTAATHYAYELPYREALRGLSDPLMTTDLLLADEHKAFCQQLARDLDLED